MPGTPVQEALAPSNLQTVTEQTQPGQDDPERLRRLAVEAVLSDIRATFGISFVPDLFAMLEKKPAYLDAAGDLFKTDLDLDVLDDRTKRIVAVALNTNARGVYLMAALPQVFSLSPVGPKRCETILSIIEMFHTFTRYLSDVGILHTETADIGHRFA